MGKKGTGFNLIIKIVVALAFASALLFWALPIIAQTLQGSKEVGTCGGVSIGGKQGVCVPESTYCNEKITSSSMCGKYPGRPVCCYDSAVIAEVSATRYCLCYENSERKTITLYHAYETSDECERSCTPASCSSSTSAVASCVPITEINLPIKCGNNDNCYPNIERCKSACTTCVFDTTSCKT